MPCEASQRRRVSRAVRDTASSRQVCLFVLLAILLPLTSQAGVDKKLGIFVSIIPQEYFVKRIGGNRVNVQGLVKPGHSPATYEPTPRQMAALSEADMYFRIGVPFENAFMPGIQDMMKNLTVVDTRDGIELREIDRHEHAHHDTHDHAEDNHEHGSLDPHIWLSPKLVKIQARTIAAALSEKDPAGKEAYDRNLSDFLADLDRLDTSLSTSLALAKGKTFMVFHPSWGYFADDYGLKQEPIEVNGKDPTARQLTRIIETARAESISIIFVQPQFSSSKAKTVTSAIHGVVVPIDPLARDYILNLQKAGETIGKALSEQISENDKQ